MITSPDHSGTSAGTSAGGRDASVDRDDGAGHVCTGARGEVDGDAGHVLGAADPAERRAGGDLRAERLQGRGHHLRLEGAGGDALTVIPRGPSSFARTRVRWCSAALLEEYE